IIRIPLNENSPRVVGVAVAAAFPSQRVASLLSGDFGTAWNSRMETGVAGRERPFGIQISNVECVRFCVVETSCDMRDNLAGQPIVVDFSPVTDFQEATCMRYEENTCNHG
ncbi:splicing factor U2af small subunit B-like protein, partial [Tanacetum coccineum]